MTTQEGCLVTQPIDSFIAFIEDEHASALASYRARPDNIRENYGQEKSIVQGGYGRKQLQELVQNAIDPLKDEPGDIRVILTDDCLYVANQGRPFDKAGVKTLLHSNMSDKRDDQIGRFGLGFKSVLQVSDKPQIFSGPLAFGFDAERSRQELSIIAPDSPGYPALRLPYSLNAEQEQASDATLDELRREFITVVKLPLNDGHDLLWSQIRDFPGEVLLFSPAVRRLEMEVRGVRALRRVWTAEDTTHSLPKNIRAVVLSYNNTDEEWLVASLDYVPTAKAQLDAGSLHARSHTTVTWAVPRRQSNARRRGLAWNYFPTKTEFTLGGIVNAAFKMNDDRVSILETSYNEEIFSKAVPRLVAALIPLLSTDEDPAAHFNVMPARGNEDTPWIRDVLIDPVTRALAMIASVPDQNGDLQPLAGLSIRPKLSTDEATDITPRWQQAAREADVREWVHESALSSAFRSALVDRLAELTGGTRATEQEWIEGLAEPGTTTAFGAAIRFAHAFMSYRLGASTFGDVEPIRRARIIPRRNGTVSDLRSPLTLQATPTQSDTGVVDPAITHEDGVLPILMGWGAKRLEGVNLLAEVLGDLMTLPDLDPADVLSFWQIAAEQAVDNGTAVLKAVRDAVRKGPVPVVTAAGTVRPLSAVWTAGPLLDSARKEDQEMALKDGHPYLSGQIPQLLRIPSDLDAQVQVPFNQTPAEWRSEVRALCQDEALRRYGTSAKVGQRLDVLGGGKVGMTELLDQLVDASPETRSNVTVKLLSRRVVQKVEYETHVRDAGESFLFTDTLPVPNVDGWWVSRHGVVRTAYGFTPVKDCVVLDTTVPAELLPTPTQSSLPATDWNALGATTDVDRVNWQRVLGVAVEAVARGSFPLSALHSLYGHLALAGVRAPRTLLAARDSGHCESMPLGELVLPWDETTNDHLVAVGFQGGRIVVDDPRLRDALAEAWKIRPLAVTYQTEIVATTDTDKEQKTLLDRFPYLPQTEGKLRKFKGYMMVPATKLVLRTTNDLDSTVIEDDRHALLVDEQAKRFYYRSTLREQGILARLLAHVGSSRHVADVQQKMAEARIDDIKHSQWRALKAMSSDQERVLHLLGEERLRHLIPDAALELVREDPSVRLDPDVLYRMAQNVHGANLWAAMTSTMDASEETEAWIKDIGNKDVGELGFSADFVSPRIPKPPAREEVMGPIRLNELHAYQEATATLVCQTLAAPPGENKGLVQLPTGAGKTRVAVESLIRNAKRLHREGQTRHVILWIAQTEELCEQAVAAWTSAWRAIGIQREQMIVSRLWAGRSVTREDSHLQVVVSTYQTLASVAGAADDSARKIRYEWLSDPDVVVIDEAHGATTSSYTEILQWTRRSTGQRGKALLGLSATPYRGRNEEQTRLLVKRFGENLIEPVGHFTAENAHDYLQEKRVLARVRQVSLDGTILQRRTQKSPPGIARSHNQDGRLRALEDLIDLGSVANDATRNASILQDLADRVANEGLRHVIVFAASVAHAQALASVLDVKGISAAAIHGGTDPARRRSLVESFSRGDLNVLTNFDVLSQGFDAPLVDAVYLCRPTFSPNKYIQMIGRGLRGPANGGSEEVLIVNIDDNLENFSENLAFTEFAYLWEGSAK